MMFSRFSDRYWIKVSTFQKHRLCFSRHSRGQASEHTGNTERLFFIANHQILVGKLPLHLIQGYKFSTLRQRLYDNMLTQYLIPVKGMQRLSYFMKHIISDINNAIDRTH